MTTPHVLEQLPLWVEGDLTAQEQAEVERHLAACPSCQAAARNLSTSQTWLREALASPFDAADQARLRGRVLDHLRTEGAAKPVPRLTLRRGFLAACAASLLVATLVWRSGRSEKVEPSMPVVAPTPGMATTLPAAAQSPMTAPPPSVPARVLPRTRGVSPSPAGPARIEFQTSDPTIRIIWLAQASVLPSPTPALEEES